MIAVLCIVNETNLLHLMRVNVSVLEAINPCLDGFNGGCHADGDCIHTGPNKVGGKYKQTMHIASKQIKYNLSEYRDSAGKYNFQ